jgi:hypothetical protein
LSFAAAIAAPEPAAAAGGESVILNDDRGTVASPPAAETGRHAQRQRPAIRIQQTVMLFMILVLQDIFLHVPAIL